VWYGVRSLLMDCCPCIITIIGTGVVEGYAIFTEARESRLDLIGFGIRFCNGLDN